MTNRYFIKKTGVAALLLVASLASGKAFGQVYSASDSNAKPVMPPKPAPVKKPKPITKEWSAGLRLNSDGWSLVYEIGKAKTQDMKRVDKFHDVRILQIEFSERRNPRELRIYGWDKDHQSDKMYVYGKVNNFYALKFNWGYRKMLAGKPFARTISVHWVNAGGVTLGLLKPYYVSAYTPNGKENIKYTPETAPYFLEPLYIIGSAGLSQGLGQIKFVPGLHLKTGFHFDFAKDKFAVSAVEAGGSVELYSKKIELMATQPSNAVFFNLYAGVQFGRRRR